MGLKGQPPVIDGDFSEAVKPDDCMWNVADGVIEINLTKVDQMHWWKNVIKGEPEINVQKVRKDGARGLGA